MLIHCQEIIQRFPQHFNDTVYIQPRMIAQAEKKKCTRGAAAETEPENDTFTGAECVELSVSKHKAARFS